MHFLRKNEMRDARTLLQLRAGVRVKLIGKESEQQLVVDVREDEDAESPLIILKHDVQVAPLPDRVKVFDPIENKQIKPSGRFFVSTETFDPYHVVCDMPKDW